MPAIRTGLAAASAAARHLVSAVLRRLLPTSARFGFPWMHRPDGLVTFRESGFVSASSPSMLLARHNFEVMRIREELAGVGAKRSLEIGCGFGRLSETFAEFSNEHVAVDINEDALTMARSTYPGIEYVSAAAGDLPFESASFDLITTWTVIQHIRPELIEATVTELKRVLSPGGTVLICEETRDPEGSGGHSWHRRVEDYQRLFAPLTLLRHGYIEEIDRLQGMVSPGEVMLFR